MSREREIFSTKAWETTDVMHRMFSVLFPWAHAGDNLNTF